MNTIRFEPQPGTRVRAASGTSIISTLWSKVRKRTPSRSSSIRSAPNLRGSSLSKDVSRAFGTTSPVSVHSHSSSSSASSVPRLALLFDNVPPRFDPNVTLSGPVPSLIPPFKRLHIPCTGSSCEVGDSISHEVAEVHAWTIPAMHFVSLSGSIFSSYPRTTLDFSRALLQRFTVREELGSGRGYALLQVAERNGAMYTMRLEHGKPENRDKVDSRSGEAESSMAYANSVTIADVFFGSEQPFVSFLHTLDKLVQRWESENKWKQRGNSLSFTLWIAKQLAECDSDWAEDPTYAWIQESGPKPTKRVEPNSEHQRDPRAASHGTSDLAERGEAIIEVEEMEPVYLQSILSDEETASELSGPTSITLFGPLDDDVSDVIKAMAIFEAEAAPGAVAIP